MLTPSFLTRSIFLVALATLSISDCAFADPVSFTLSSVSLTASPGSTLVFDGTISNNLGTGESLDAFSFFFNFNNFDPSALSNPVQILPLNGIDFSILDGATSANVELFSVDLLGGAVAGKPYAIDVTLQALNAAGDTLLGNTVEASVTPSGATTGVPEPTTLVLLANGLLLSTLCKKRALFFRPVTEQ